MAETLWKNSLTPKHVWIIQANFIITATTFWEKMEELLSYRPSHL
jgi:hypothetical protein